MCKQVGEACETLLATPELIDQVSYQVKKSCCRPVLSLCIYLLLAQFKA